MAHAIRGRFAQPPGGLTPRHTLDCGRLIVELTAVILPQEALDETAHLACSGRVEVLAGIDKPVA